MKPIRTGVSAPLQRERPTQNTPALARALAELHKAEAALPLLPRIAGEGDQAQPGGGAARQREQMFREAPRNGRSGASPREPSDRGGHPVHSPAHRPAGENAQQGGKTAPAPADPDLNP